MSDAYENLPYSVVTVSLDDPISIADAKTFNHYQNMMAAEKELEEKTLLGVLNEVKEELYEEQLSDNVFVFNPNKLLEDET